MKLIAGYSIGQISQPLPYKKRFHYHYESGLRDHINLKSTEMNIKNRALDKKKGRASDDNANIYLEHLKNR